MLGISRWTPVGGSYRTVQRFFLHGFTLGYNVVGIFSFFICSTKMTFICSLAMTFVVTKAGKETYSLDRFFASLYGKPVPGLSFFALSLVSVQ